MATQRPVIFTQENTQDIKLYNLQDVDTMQFWNAAVASAVLVDQNGNATMVNNVILDYQVGSNGNYSGTVTTDCTLLIGSGYLLRIDAYQDGARFHLDLPAVVMARQS